MRLNLLSSSAKSFIVVVSFTMLWVSLPPVLAEETRQTVDWGRLNLSGQQAHQIQGLEQDWNNKYVRIQPQILDCQRQLVKILADPKSDPLEIMFCQQTIARSKEQLRNEATANYLRKRAVLNESQQRCLEYQLQQVVSDRQRTMLPGSSSEEENSGFAGLMHKVRWAIDPH